MKPSMSSIILGILCALLLGSTVYLLGRNRKKDAQIRDLNEKIADLSEKERRSSIVQSISRQMEEIAYQQKDISEEQRLEALEQTALANKMRDRSEVERKNALIARQSALEAEKTALEAYANAEEQRNTAEAEKTNAQIARRRADTLRLQSLAIAVANMATTRNRTGDAELSGLLAYTAYDLMKESGGDVRYPDIYQALSTAFGGITKWTYHAGAIKCVSCRPSWEKVFVTGTSYGDLHWQKFDNLQLEHRNLISDPSYDWRDVLYADDERIYALSYTGHLYCKNGENPHTIGKLPGEKFFKILRHGKDNLLLVSESALCWYDCKTGTVTDTRPLSAPLSCASLYLGAPALFTKDGKMLLVDENHETRSGDTPPCTGITAYYHDDKGGLSAYGTSEGVIYLVSDSGASLRLVGHRSRISQIYISGSNVYSASYDGAINTWNLEQARLEPMSLYSGNSWLECFFVQQREDFMWAGAADGTLVDVAISPDVMAQKLREKFTRNMTPEEWEAYVGEDVPYRQYLED